jgi:hypothetical protein
VKGYNEISWVMQRIRIEQAKNLKSNDINQTAEAELAGV